ncbi:ubl carboxyl-terminal hydrolase 18 isoform X1 [Carcharodon carcharias]|uniref:ubl carboxyl-terminal hydrolase 18 isoform X1 n=2 Tax=Carcharodon carcharias TaxID=13397 RepID=UPI001B7E9325|nr:ubl carboxyl-terminal hydrolase 18 isoform X1 [Carcharodon carcharias]
MEGRSEGDGERGKQRLIVTGERETRSGRGFGAGAEGFLVLRIGSEISETIEKLAQLFDLTLGGPSAGVGDLLERQKSFESKESPGSAGAMGRIVSRRNFQPARPLDNSDTGRNSADDLTAGRLDKEEGQPQSPWPYTNARFKNGIVGLKNDGLTCCVNALLQSFYLTPQFTSILQRWDQRGEVVDPGNIPYAMCRLFDQMQASVSGMVSAEMFLHCLRLNHVKVYKQHDAEELFLIIFNLLMDQLRAPEMVKEMKRLYEIKVEQFVKCDSGTVTVKDSSLLSLPLPVREMGHGGVFNLEDALKEFFNPRELTRNDQCFCPDFQREKPAVQGFKLVSVPEILNLHLNRFSVPISPGGMIKKIYSSVAFPENLNLDHLPISEKSQEAGNGQECWLYQLHAVLAHSGFPFFGHYTVYVKSFRDSKWYHMNDSKVSQVSWADVTLTFGGHESKWTETAYMLLYKRVKQETETPSAAGQ